MSLSAAQSQTPLNTQETLRALQQAWFAAEQREAATSRLPLRESFLNLRAVPQISMRDASEAFPMTNSAFPPPWKDQIRQLRNRLTQAQAELESGEEGLQVVAFTSMDCRRPRHGTATNLALSMASIRDMRVLVIDANLSNPTLHSAMQIAPGPGLGEATHVDRLALPQCFRRLAGSQVYLQTIGDLHAHPLDPMALRGLHNLLRSLRSQFDWIFLDGPGFDTPSDAVALSMAADGVIMMIDSEHDSFRKVASALSHVQDRRMLGAVMF